MSDSKLTLTGLKLENFAGFQTFEAKLDQLTVFTGPNGSGKTSVLNAIAAAVATRGGIDPEMIRIDKDRAMVAIQLTEDLEVVKTRTRGKPQRVVVKDDGVAYKQTSKLLKKLLDPVNLKPMEWLQGDRTAALLESFPLTINQATVNELLGGIPSPMGIDFDRHAIKVLAGIDGSLMEFRRAKKASAEALTKVIADADAQPQLEDPSEELAKQEQASRDALRALGMAEDQADALSMAKSKLRDAGERREQFARRIADLERQLQQARDDHAATETMVTREEEALAALPQPPDVTEQRAAMDRADARITELTGVRGAYHQQLQERGRIDGERDRLSTLKTTIESMTSALAAIRAKPGEMLAAADLPIEGLAYKEGMLTLNGKPVATLSTGETMRLAAKVAIHRVQSQRGQFVLVDKMEHLDKRGLAALMEEMKASAPIQWICTDVGERDYGEGAMVVVLGEEDSP